MIAHPMTAEVRRIFDQLRQQPCAALGLRYCYERLNGQTLSVESRERLARALSLVPRQRPAENEKLKRPNAGRPSAAPISPDAAEPVAHREWGFL